MCKDLHYFWELKNIIHVHNRILRKQENFKEEKIMYQPAKDNYYEDFQRFLSFYLCVCFL